MLQVDGDDASVSVVLRWIDAADNAGSAAVRDGSQVVSAAPVVKINDVLFRPGVGDDVGRVAKLLAQCPRYVDGARSIGVV